MATCNFWYKNRSIRCSTICYTPKWTSQTLHYYRCQWFWSWTSWQNTQCWCKRIIHPQKWLLSDQCYEKKTVEIQGHRISHWKPLRCIRYEPKGLRYRGILDICQDVLKSAILPNELPKIHFFARHCVF